MANHHDNHYEPPRPAQATSYFGIRGPSSDVAPTGEDDLAVDTDEPPEHPMQFSRRPTPYNQSSTNDAISYASPIPRRDHKQSLLTQALLTSPDLVPTSTRELLKLSNQPRTRSAASTYSTTSAPSTAELTSDEGLTSPARTNTPSPPLPSTNHTGLEVITPKGIVNLDNIHNTDEIHLQTVGNTYVDMEGTQSDAVKAGLGQKRCITFACGRGTAPAEEISKAAEVTKPSNEPPRRNCMLRFACPFKPSQDGSSNTRVEDEAVSTAPLASRATVKAVKRSNLLQHLDSESTIKSSAAGSITPNQDNRHSGKSPIPSLEQPGATAGKYHGYAGLVEQGDEWTHEKPSQRRKITVTDTLRKENVIRRLGEEAEEEALEEEAEAENDSDGDLDNAQDNGEDDIGSDDDENEEEDNDDVASDGGNETDNEEGFADSDEESDVDSQYQFWTAGSTTAATSADHIDNIRSRPQRSASESSIDSIVKPSGVQIINTKMHSASRRSQRAKLSPKMRPGTPDLPDSTDFVCGTLDEDRPLEAAYVSCMAQRRQAKHKLIPQDFDPSFPTSDPEDQDEEENDAVQGSDENIWVAGRPDDSDRDSQRGPRNKSKNRVNAPTLSPKRLRSPPPPRRGRVPKSPPPPILTRRGPTNRSPPPRRLFGQSPRGLRSYAPQVLNLKSPSSSRRPSVSSPTKKGAPAIDMPHLAQCPNLTHTKSLPRTPNPFWREHREARTHALVGSGTGVPYKNRGERGADIHSRGPIDIVQGLENKKQRRKEKFWRQNCRNAYKDKERRCLPGKGAQRMKELGLEMAGKSKGTELKTALVLSI
ncbi:hypothetical protein MMC06_003409 [Schaereria dolodes]|nr:hypothetical protein [Schaereria dolodes]